MSQPKRDKYSTNHNPKYGYVRIGIYYEKRLGKPYIIRQLNLCDLHFERLLLRGESWEGSYIEAKKSISQMTGGGRAPWGIRTPKDEEKLLATGEVDNRNRLANGGRAVLLLNKPTSVNECWLFGPLEFWDITVGSLLLKLSGLQFPVMWTRYGGPDKDDVHWLEFPKGFGASRGPCTLWGSYYTGVHHGRRSDDYVPDLLKQRKHVFPIDATRRYTWKVEAHFGNLTVHEAREKRDTTKHAFYDRAAL